MLALTRKPELNKDKIIITSPNNKKLIIKLISVQGRCIRLGFDGDIEEFNILREELDRK